MCVSAHPHHPLWPSLCLPNEFAASVLSHVSPREESSLLEQKVSDNVAVPLIRGQSFNIAMLRKFRLLGVRKVFSFHFLLHWSASHQEPQGPRNKRRESRRAALVDHLGSTSKPLVYTWKVLENTFPLHVGVSEKKKKERNSTEFSSWKDTLGNARDRGRTWDLQKSSVSLEKINVKIHSGPRFAFH